jgi:hypothetical protein
MVLGLGRRHAAALRGAGSGLGYKLARADIDTRVDEVLRSRLPELLAGSWSGAHG